eukprot:PhF_6_TR25132/c0_g1_i2/m.34586
MSSTQSVLKWIILVIVCCLVYWNIRGGGSYTQEPHDEIAPPSTPVEDPSPPAVFPLPSVIATHEVISPPPHLKKNEENSPELQPGAASFTSECPKRSFGDAYDTGNQPYDESAIRAPEVAFSFPPSPSTSTFVTSFVRAAEDKKSPLCYYRVTNFCVIRQSLVFFIPPNERQNNKDFDSLRLCCELRPKFQLRYAIRSPPSRPPYPIQANQSTAHVAGCWQFYGYHLLQCLVSVWWTQKSHFRDTHNIRMWLYNHAQSFPREVREHYSHKMYLGSKSSWMLDVPGKYWALWSQSTQNPDSVSELFKFQTDAQGGECYSHGLIGQPHHDTIPWETRKAHSLMMLRKFQIKRSIRSSSTKLRITLAVRGTGRVQGSRALTNNEDVAKLLREYGELRMVDWATLTIPQQLEAAANTNILVTPHGAGNLWL